MGAFLNYEEEDVSLMKKAIKWMKRAIKRYEASYFAYVYEILRCMPIYELMEALKNICPLITILIPGYVLLEMIVTQVLENMSYQDIKLLATYFFPYVFSSEEN